MHAKVVEGALKYFVHREMCFGLPDEISNKMQEKGDSSKTGKS